MDARELRYGNFALCERCDGTKVETQAFELKASGTWLSRVGLPITDPIPLTEEWLTRFGFCQWDDYWGHESSDFDIKKIGNGYCFRVDDAEHAPSLTHYFAHHTKYVHQLQNLYFALTGEELELKDAENNHR